MVVVVRADTYHDRFLSNRSVRILLDRIRDARTAHPVASPRLAPLDVAPSSEAAPGPDPASRWRSYLGELSLPRSGVVVRISEVDGRPHLDFGQGLFALRPLSPGRFVVVDSRDTLIVGLDAAGRIHTVLSEPIVYLEAAAAARSGEIHEAIAWVSRAVEAFPEAPGPRINLARALAGAGDRTGARAQVDTALMLDPAYPGAAQMRRALGTRRFLPLAAAVLIVAVGAIVWRRKARPSPLVG